MNIIFVLLMLLSSVYQYEIVDRNDDGTEVSQNAWYGNGFPAFSGKNRIGNFNGEQYILGLRFGVEDLNKGEEIAFARLRFASFGSFITSGTELLIEGVLQDSATPFSPNSRPSQKLPKTTNKIYWRIHEAWDAGNNNLPLYYDSPNLAPIINEIIALSEWGQDGKYIVFSISGVGEGENYVVCGDRSIANCRCPVKLEIRQTLYDCLDGGILLGRPAENSIDINLFPLVDMDIKIEYCMAQDPSIVKSLEYNNRIANNPLPVKVEDLVADKRYLYRVSCKTDDEWCFGDIGNFRTERGKNSAFNFIVQADEHIMDVVDPSAGQGEHRALYGVTVENIASKRSDLILSLGDFANPEAPNTRNAQNLNDAQERYLFQRRLFKKWSYLIPFYAVIGNHEGEQGWYNNDGLSLIAREARKNIMLNPMENTEGNYFAWEWGNALFIALDPYYCTKVQPHDWHGSGSHNGWDWTLGKTQYDWLYETLSTSDAQWKFVFIHHLVSTTTDGNLPYYGRGGIEVAKYKVASRPSFEWGGENEHGAYVFHAKRPGWSHGPIHDVLDAFDVTAVFHGHDHFFCKQDLDGIVYQECPRAADSTYNYGFPDNSCYENGVVLPNSGFLYVHVGVDAVRVQYIRSFLPGDGNNNSVAYEYTIEE